MAAVIKPRVTGPDPPDPVWLNVVIQKPDAGVRGRLAGPQHGIGGGRSRCLWQVVDRYYPCAGCHLERAGVSGGDRRLQIASVDDFAAHHDIVKLPRAQIPDMLAVTSAAQVLMAGEQPDPPRLRKPRGRLGEVLADFAAGCPFVVSGVLAGLVDPVITEGERVNPVVRGRRMQAKERIRVQPMASRGRAAVDHSHLNICLGRQRVDERKAGRTRSHD